MPITIPTSAIDSFNLDQQKDLRRLAEMILSAASGGQTFKFIEEQGDAADSGTVLSDSEIVATVASLDSDIISSTNSVLVGGSLNEINTLADSVIVGGDSNTIVGVDLGQSNGIFVAGLSTMTDSEYCASVGGRNNGHASNERCAFLAGNSNDIQNSFDSVIIGSATSSITSSTNVLLGGSSEGIVEGSNNSIIVGAISGFLIDSMSSGIIGGFDNSIISGNNSVALGGDSNSPSGQNCFTVGGTSNVVTGTSNGILGGTDNYAGAGVISNSIILGGYNNSLQDGVARSVILGGSRCSVVEGGSDLAVLGQDGYAHRAWGITISGGPNTNPDVDVCQGGILSGSSKTLSDDPSSAPFYISNTAAVEVLANSTLSFKFVVTAVRTSDNASHTISGRGCFKRVGAATPAIVFFSIDENSGELTGVDVSAGTPEVDGIPILAEGLVGSNIVWGITIWYQELQLAV